MAQQLLNAVILGSILLLFSYGLSLAWGTLDVMNLAHGSLFVVGGYIGFVLGTKTSLPFVAVLVAAVIAGGLVASVMELVAFGQIRMRIRNKRQAELSTLVASLGAGMIVNQYVSNKTGNGVFAPGGRVFDVRPYEFAGVRITNIEILILVLTLLVGVGLSAWIRKSRQGRAVRAVAYSPDTSALMGVSVTGLGMKTMFLSGALAGLAGVLLAIRISGQTVATGESYMLSAFAILVVGGVGSLTGATIAAYGIALAETMVVAYGPAGYRDGVAYALIFATLLIRPQGLFARRRSERA